MGIFLRIPFFGALDPRMPYQSHTSLHLLWTVSDEDMWNLDHKITGSISLLITPMYLGIALPRSDTNSSGTISVIATEYQRSYC